MIKVIDSIMGSGKTSYIIQLLNNNAFSDNPRKFLVATPYLDQVTDIKNKVPGAIVPKRTSVNKSVNLVKLLKEEVDIIICCHELLNRINDYDLLKPYTLIIDEAIDVIEVMDDDGEQDTDKAISIEDLNILKTAGYVQENKDGFLEWIANEYTGIVYSNIYTHLRNGVLTIRENKVFKLLPRQFLSAAQEIMVFTYLFEGQNMYYYCRYFDIPFEYWHIIQNEGQYDIAPGKTIDDVKCFPIDVYQGPLNDIGEKGMSVNWYKKTAEPRDLRDLSRNIYNYIKNKTIPRPKIKDVIWTTFKKYSSDIAKDNDKLKIEKENRAKKESKAEKNKSNFLSCTSRATNNYKEASIVVYAVNRYPKPEIERFFQTKEDITFDKNSFALQEMLQFIWRSAIREGNHIHAYIPSKRMREIFLEWLKPQTEKATERSHYFSVNHSLKP